MPTAAMVVIGDEILSGKFADENGPFAIRRLRELGADLGRLVTIRDDVSVIGDEIVACARHHDLVLTTGGVGPTHDDVTFEGVARGLGVPLERRTELVEMLERFKVPLTDASLRMATVPAGAELVMGGPDDIPIVRAGKVYVFPGVPSLFRRGFERVAARFAGAIVSSRRVATRAGEVEIAPLLTDVQSRFPSVAIGSYPRRDRVLVTFESRDVAALDAAFSAVRAGLPDPFDEESG